MSIDTSTQDQTINKINGLRNHLRRNFRPDAADTAEFTWFPLAKLPVKQNDEGYEGENVEYGLVFCDPKSLGNFDLYCSWEIEHSGSPTFIKADSIPPWLRRKFEENYEEIRKHFWIPDTEVFRFAQLIALGLDKKLWYDATADDVDAFTLSLIDQGVHEYWELEKYIDFIEPLEQTLCIREDLDRYLGRNIISYLGNRRNTYKWTSTKEIRLTVPLALAIRRAGTLPSK